MLHVKQKRKRSCFVRNFARHTQYGNTGCQVFKRRVKHQKDFLTASPRSPMPIFGHFISFRRHFMFCRKIVSIPIIYCKVQIEQLLGSRQAVVRQSSGSRQTVIRQSSSKACLFQFLICHARGHWKSFAWPCFLRINLPKGNYRIVRIGVVASCQKLDIIFVIEWFKNNVIKKYQ